MLEQSPYLYKLECTVLRELKNLCTTLSAQVLERVDFLREGNFGLSYTLMIEAHDDPECDPATDLVLRMTDVLKKIQEPIRAIYFALEPHDFDEMVQARLHVFVRVEEVMATSTVEITEVQPDALPEPPPIPYSQLFEPL